MIFEHLLSPHSSNTTPDNHPPTHSPNTLFTSLVVCSRPPPIFLLFLHSHQIAGYASLLLAVLAVLSGIDHADSLSYIADPSPYHAALALPLVKRQDLLMLLLTLLLLTYLLLLLLLLLPLFVTLVAHTSTFSFNFPL